MPGSAAAPPVSVRAPRHARERALVLDAPRKEDELAAEDVPGTTPVWPGIETEHRGRGVGMVVARGERKPRIKVRGHRAMIKDILYGERGIRRVVACAASPAS